VRKTTAFCALLMLLAVSMTGVAAQTKSNAKAQTQPTGEPEHIQVQHILISFTGKVPGKDITRTEAEAKELAYKLLERINNGEDFDALVKEFTNDAHPGIYGMSNRGVEPVGGESPRTGMVPAFGNVGFTLKVGEVGIADYDPKTSPYGWHIVKRLK
jgi:hypothetical protein